VSVCGSDDFFFFILLCAPPQKGPPLPYPQVCIHVIYNSHFLTPLSLLLRYIDIEAPWLLKKTDKARMGTVLCVLVEVLRRVAICVRDYYYKIYALYLCLPFVSHFSLHIYLFAFLVDYSLYFTLICFVGGGGNIGLAVDALRLFQDAG
jgi:hypothetical protein